MTFAITDNVVKTPRHTSFYLASGSEDAPPIVFVHGWPELSNSWRHQLPCFASLGFRAIAPDMRGYGRSSVYGRHEDYALSHAVQDMLELLDALGHKRAVWVGHDWGSPVVWSLAAHHPEKCIGIANLCVPHIPDGFAPDNLLPLVDRTLYPEDQFPAGQWEYMKFYEESFDKARLAFEANVKATVKALFRTGDPAGKGVPAGTAYARKLNGIMGGLSQAPDVPIDSHVISDEDWHKYSAALERNGFFGPDSWYMNAGRNIDYARPAAASPLHMPVLFLHASYDYVCATVGTRLADPMRNACRNLTEVTIDSGHWMAQEKPIEVNAALAKWLANQIPDLWPV